METISLKITKERILSYTKRLNLGQKYDNDILSIIFDLEDSDMKLAYNYVVLRKPSGEVEYILLNDELTFVVTNSITRYPGLWKLMYLAVDNEIDKDGKLPTTVKTITSSPLLASVGDSGIIDSTIDESKLDSNIQILYDDLLNLKKTLELYLGTATGGSGGSCGTIDTSKIEKKIDSLSVSISSLQATTDTIKVDSSNAFLNGMNTKLINQFLRKSGIRKSDKGLFRQNPHHFPMPCHGILSIARLIQCQIIAKS